MRPILVAVALLVLGVVQPVAAQQPKEPVLLTVTGAIAKGNRPAFSAFDDAFLGFHEADFEHARGFTLPALRALGMQELSTGYPGWPRPVIQFRGPTMAALLDAVGATGKTVSVQALDGYAVSFDVDTLRSGKFILALEADGEPLALGGRGPAWLVFPPGADPELPGDTDEGLVWAVFHIKVE
jgi:hypothetical protein